MEMVLLDISCLFLITRILRWHLKFHPSPQSFALTSTGLFILPCLFLLQSIATISHIWEILRQQSTAKQPYWVHNEIFLLNSCSCIAKAESGFNLDFRLRLCIMTTKILFCISIQTFLSGWGSSVSMRLYDNIVKPPFNTLLQVM